MTYHMRAWLHHLVLNIGFAAFLFKQRSFAQAVKAVFFAFFPPQFHHNKKDIKNLSKNSCLYWYKFGSRDE